MRSETQPYSNVLQYRCIALRMRFFSQHFGTIKWILPGSSSPSHREGPGTEIEPETPQTWWKLWILPVCCKLSTSYTTSSLLASSICIKSAEISCYFQTCPVAKPARHLVMQIQIYSQNTKSVPLPLLYSVVIYCTLFCFSVAKSGLSANIATFVFEMICFNQGSVFQW